MPISAIDGLTAEHWVEVQNIIRESIQTIEGYDCEVSLVSDADDVGVIQKRIVQNIYASDVIVCDVSGKNPNVMFELGMRLAFDKPTVIVKDDKTDYSFDTSVIEHIPYPRDLRFAQIVAFKRRLAAKVVATYKAALDDPEHSIFLKNFGKFKVKNLSEKEGAADQLLVDMMVDLQGKVTSISNLLRVKQNEESELRVLNRVNFQTKPPQVRQMVEEHIVGYALETEVNSYQELLGHYNELARYIKRKAENSLVDNYFPNIDELETYVFNLLTVNSSGLPSKLLKVITANRVRGSASEVKSADN